MHQGQYQSCQRRLFKYLIPVILFALLFNIPKFFEATISHKTLQIAESDNNSNSNETTVWRNVTKTFIDTTDLRENPYYSIYYNTVGRGAVLSFLPSVLLIGLNYKIYRKIKSQPVIMVQENFQLRRQKQENNLAVLMSVISGVFVICHILRNFLNIYEIFVIQRNEECKEAGYHTFTRWSLIVTSFSNIMLVLNSSTNMVIYSFLNRPFRRQFMSISKTIVFYMSCGKTINHCVAKPQEDHPAETQMEMPELVDETAL